MLYLFYGSDKNKALKQASNIITKKLSEKTDAIVFKIDSQNLNENTLIEMCGGQGLFSQKYIVHIKDVCEQDETKEILFSFLKDIKNSENIFILTEGDLNNKDFSKIEKCAEKVWNFELVKKEKKEENIFSLTDHLFLRDKKNLWIEFQKFKNIFAVEEIHGTLFWAFKNIILASKSKSAHEAGLKPFVYSKAKQASTKFSEKELSENFWGLTELLALSRRGVGDLEVLLERWILEL